MTVPDKQNRDVNGFSKQKRYRILRTRKKNTSTPSCHHEQQDRRLPPTGPHASVLWTNNLHGIVEAGPHSDDGTSYQHVDVRYYY